MDFATAYCSDPTLWDNTKEEPPRRLVFLDGIEFPIEDPNNLCGMLTRDELPLLRAVNITHVEWLDLTIPSDLEKFSQIWQRHVDKWYSVFGEESFNEPGTFKKLLRYVESYYTIPPELEASLTSQLPRGSSNAMGF